MKKTLILFCILSAFGIVAIAKDIPAPMSSGNSAARPTDEYSQAKAAYERLSAGWEIGDTEKALVEKYFSLEPVDSGSPVTGTAGPDGGFYYYVDNMDGDTATFDWIELCGDPNAVNATGAGDEGTTNVLLPWPFTFYGNSYVNLVYQVNGWIQFNSGTQQNSYTPPCPWASLTHTTRIIAAYYRDQNAASYGGCNGNGTAPWMRHRIDADKLVIEWKQVPQYGSSSVFYTYEAILYADGRIKLQYNFTPPAGATGAVGVDGTGATDGVQYACGSTDLLAKIAPGRAVWFYRVLPPIPELGVSNLSPCGNIWPNNPSVPVSFRITNNGLATSPPVTAYYDFNNGATTDNYVVPAIAPNSFFDVFFNIPIDGSVNGAFTLKGWFLPHDSPPQNDSVYCVVTVPSVRPCPSMAPADVNLDPMPNTPWAGNLNGDCGNGGKWDGSFSAVAGRDYHFDLCPDAPGAGTANFDIDIKICDANGAIIVGQDGTCTALSYRPNNFTWTATASGLYYVVLAPYSSYSSHNCGGTASSTFTMQYYETLPCAVNCQNGAPEGEPPCANNYVDVFNGGCNSVPPAFSPVACGQTICGKAGTFLDVNGNNARDTDWYELNLAQRDSVRWTVSAEFPVLVGIIAQCSPSPVYFYASTVGGACEATVVSRCLDAGTWYLFVAPNTFTGVPCDADYMATLECLPCEAPPCPYPNFDAEPVNDICGSAAPVVQCGQFYCGRIINPYDRDVYQLVITETDTVKINVFANDSPTQWPYGQGLDSRVTVYGANCDSLYYNDDFMGQGNDPIHWDSGLRLACLAPGTYYIKVWPYSGSEGPYVLNVECSPCCSPTPTVDFERYPIPQYACATVCAGSTTLIRICQPGAPFIPGLTPIVTVVPGCQTEGCQVVCDPGQFTYDPALWYINPDNGCWENVVGGAANGCVCISLEGFLDVELQGFSFTVGNRSVTLNWSTASEASNDHFEVMRDGAKVAELDALGSSSSGASYSWTDRNLTNGTTYSYSLVAVDVAGNRGVLRTVEATPTADVVITEYALQQNYPNPFNPTTSITFDLVEGGNVSLHVYNMMGQAVATLVNGSFSAGRHTVNFDATGLPSGLYIYRIESNGFVSQHKMLLMK